MFQQYNKAKNNFLKPGNNPDVIYQEYNGLNNVAWKMSYKWRYSLNDVLIDKLLKS